MGHEKTTDHSLKKNTQKTRTEIASKIATGEYFGVASNLRSFE